MKWRSRQSLSLLTYLCMLCLPTIGQAQFANDPIEGLAEDLSKKLIEKKSPRVTVLDFGDIRNRPNELGRYMSLKLANELVNLEGISVLDRANLETIMAEHKLTAEGLLKPEGAKKLGEFASVDAFMIGTISAMGENLEIFVRAIATESSEIVASGNMRLPFNETFREMLTQSVTSVGTVAGSKGSGPAKGGASAVEGDAIATVSIGPITAVLRSVNSYGIEVDEMTVPGLRCSFELENRNLDRYVAVAANQRVLDTQDGLEHLGYRGGVVDSLRVPWRIVSVNGISAVVCFEVISGWRGNIRQMNPGGIVDYVRNAKRYDGSDELIDDQHYWSGSFDSIAPGERIRLTVDCVPANIPDQRRGSSRTEFGRPDYFQFDLELVLGTYAETEGPSKSQDLALRNLTIDRVFLSSAITDAAP